MAHVTGIGGIFFRADNPEALAAWYETHLGVGRVPAGSNAQPWQTEAGATVFAPFAADTDYFPADRRFMINFRVADLDGLLADLAAAGIEATRREETAGIGRFARITDPEGNPVELWEPAG
jgi:glyoxylase I family protein